ncbi:hypothetical protein DAPPUDRAFT_255453 [Daphnia pulex]|uniref:Uncharacterized protein n=1 Tax=Daphnia pulex TaxID=6669 RepID=E9H977_DAPPU|nr:hypothetical protein DAPPUDRAFT_255453 [Daphnia pulex]|eukprot:EFX71748.1 hypothetical protein DAPPUDRAFT_255453 [Daphnia pulex]
MDGRTPKEWPPPNSSLLVGVDLDGEERGPKAGVNPRCFYNLRDVHQHTTRVILVVMLTADLLLTTNLNAPAGIFDSQPSAAQPGTTQALDDSLNLS